MQLVCAKGADNQGAQPSYKDARVKRAFSFEFCPDAVGLLNPRWQCYDVALANVERLAFRAFA
jgi:hypothetical protein